MTALQTRPEDAGVRPAATSPPPRRFRARLRNDLVAALFLLPALFCFGYFAWWPVLKGLELSFQQTNLVDAAQWVGLDNFRRVFEDPLVTTAVENTLLFAGLALVIGFPIPLALALQISTVRRLPGLYRYLVYLPVMLPPVVSVLLWKAFYDPDSGLFNAVLGLVGLGPYPWLQSTHTAMLSLVLEATWAGLGTATLIYLAALTRVPPELYEAAETDGAGIWRRAWHIALPQLRGTVLLLLLLQFIGTLQAFTEPFVMTDGGPQNATVTVLLLIYRYAFVDGDYGAASALSLLLAAALSLMSAVYLRATRRWSN
ncbi:carbohydrate ABC transporter permease [Streptomyces sp. SPB074]|uniref:carbohydrate ABC transporter permease n=1 Tax=Streptomyces sp. (strain SPB074) TaxID=465543 RepID=UPI00017F0ED3|nr:sugar ABC transporter permease [Streptomyces sp. SPB074]EDY45729.1 ABC transporter, permease [Streptomyces sp. SPB074]